MTSYVSSTNQSAAEAVHVELVVFVVLDFPSGVIRLHTSTGTINWGSNDYIGVGKLGSISEISEDAMLRPSGVTLTISGVDSSFITEAMSADYHGHTVTVYHGFLNTTTLALVANPEVIFRGLMDIMSIELGEKSAVIQVSCEGELARWQRYANLLYSHESQQTLYPGDLGFNQIPVIQGKTIDWSKRNTGFFSFASSATRKITK